MSITTKNKKMMIKGAGKFTAKIPGCDELLTLGTMNNMRLDIQLDMMDIEGGDSSVPLDTLLRKKVIDITAEDAKFDLNMLRLVLGSKLKEGVSGATYKMVSETLTVVDNAGSLEVSVTQSIKSGGGVPTPTVKKGLVNVSDSDYSISGQKFTFTGGVAVDDSVTVYYPIDAVADKDGYVWVLEEKHVIEESGGKHKITLAFGTQLFDDAGSKTKHISIRTLKENKLLKQVTGTPGEFEYKVDDVNGDIEFNSALDKTDVYVNYKRVEVVDVLEITTKDFPLTVTVVHDGMFEQKDGSIQGYQTELYTCRVKSNFTLDAARQQASTHSVTLTVIDPERIDNRLGTIKRYEVVNENTADIC